MQDRELWKRLLAYRFDAPDGSRDFSTKLAAEERWSKSFTARVIEEYRKFLYLSQVTPGVVSPSPAVDRAWHLHLTYTREYWENLCPVVLKRPLHHEPGGSDRKNRFRDQYLSTIRLYAAEFGREPPADIWPVKGQSQGAGAQAFAFFLVGAILFLSGLVLTDAGPGLTGGLLLAGVISGLIGFALAAPSYKKSDGGGGCGGASCGSDGDGGGCGGGD